jgi:hypothetical protein
MLRAANQNEAAILSMQMTLKVPKKKLSVSQKPVFWSKVFIKDSGRRPPGILIIFKLPPINQLALRMLQAL